MDIGIKRMGRIGGLLLAAAVLAGCHAHGYGGGRTLAGGAIGAAAGGVAAAAVDAPVGLGVVAGGIAGAVIGGSSGRDDRDYGHRYRGGRY